MQRVPDAPPETRPVLHRARVDQPVDDDPRREASHQLNRTAASALYNAPAPGTSPTERTARTSRAPMWMLGLHQHLGAIRLDAGDGTAWYSSRGRASTRGASNAHGDRLTAHKAATRTPASRWERVGRHVAIREFRLRTRPVSSASPAGRSRVRPGSQVPRAGSRPLRGGSQCSEHAGEDPGESGELGLRDAGEQASGAVVAVGPPSGGQRPAARGE